ncbi:hypothetical protein CPB86DRAFT_624723 [Serendipita vermifera]|nr:hypothetical protein CPB86DRAFT_624723 [Serendipita vermifera]
MCKHVANKHGLCCRSKGYKRSNIPKHDPYTEQSVSVTCRLLEYSTNKNETGPTSHYIVQERMYGLLSRSIGAGSGGFALSRAGSQAISENGLFPGIQVLDTGGRDILLYPKTVTQWSGQVGGSFVLASLQYNPWAALDVPPILVINHANLVAICYRPAYVVGFIPLALAAIVVISWCILTLLRTPYKRLKELGDLYGGLYPYWKLVIPNLELQDIILIWQQDPNPHLEAFSPDEASVSIPCDTQNAVDYFAPLTEEELDSGKDDAEE